ALDEVLVARVAARAGAHVGDARDLLLDLGVAVATDGVSSRTEHERRKLGMLRTPRAHVLDLRGEGLGRVAMHEVGVALACDQVFRGGRLSAGVESRPGPLNGFRRKARVLDRVVTALEGELVLRPHSLKDREE